MIPWIAAAALLLTSAASARAATWTVTQSGPSGVGSFTWALTQVNAADPAEQQVIEFDLPVGQRRIQPQVASPWPTIEHPDVVIDGGAPSDLLSAERITLDVVDEPGSVFANSLLRVGPGTLRLKLQDLSLVGAYGEGLGNCLNAQTARPDVYVEIERVTFGFCQSQGHAANGIGAFGGAIFAVGSFVIRDSLFFRNEASTGDVLGILPPGSVSAAGGAIAVYYGTVLIERTGFVENRVLSDEHQAWGGAISFLGFEAGRLTIVDSHFAGNSIEPVSSLAQNPVRVGGAVHSLAEVTRIDRSSFHGNHASLGGALAVTNPEVGGPTIAEFRVENTLIHGNTAELGGGGVHVDLPGVRYAQRNLTFVDNRLVAGHQGAHLHMLQDSVLATSHSIIFGAIDGLQAGTPCRLDGVQTPGDAVIGNSLGIEEDGVQSCAGAGAFPVADNDAIGLSPAGPVATAIGNQYWPLVAGGLAIDGGAAGAADGSDWSRCAPVDAVGTERPVDGDGDGAARCDIGAVEFRVVAPAMFIDGFED